MPVSWAGHCPCAAPAPATLASLHEDAGRLVTRLSGVFLGEPPGMPLPSSFSTLVFVVTDVLNSMYAAHGVCLFYLSLRQAYTSHVSLPGTMGRCSNAARDTGL